LVEAPELEAGPRVAAIADAAEQRRGVARIRGGALAGEVRARRRHAAEVGPGVAGAAVGVDLLGVAGDRARVVRVPELEAPARAALVAGGAKEAHRALGVGGDRGPGEGDR